jgi:hypothetical protein
MGRRRLSAEKREAVIELDRANPEATQAEIVRTVGISRPSQPDRASALALQSRNRRLTHISGRLRYVVTVSSPVTP